MDHRGTATIASSERTESLSRQSGERRPRVMKFGGTSVRDASAMNRVVEIVRTGLTSGDVSTIVVASACAGITDMLVECAACCSGGDHQRSREIIRAIEDHHTAVLHDLAADRPEAEIVGELAGELAGELERLSRLVEGSALLGETTPRTVDAILATGELLSTILLRGAFLRAGIPTLRLRSDQVLITDDRHGCACPDMAGTRSRAAEVLLPALNDVRVVVLQGFVGGTPDGVTTTLGRGGSDYSAALIGSAVDAEAIEIWTDVDGILTADPRIVPSARPIERISFSGARELAWFGAKVIHPDTILPAVERGIPVVILNSHNPESAGTTILPDSENIPPGFYSLTGRRNLTVLELSSPTPGGSGEQGSRPGRRLSIVEGLGLFAAHNIPILCSVAAESSASVVIPSESWSEPFRTVLGSSLSVEVHRNAALLCLGGACVRRTPALLADPLAALRGIPIRLVAAGASDHSVLLALDESLLDESLRALHAVLFEPTGAGTPAE